MTEQDIDRMEAGPELNRLVAEGVMGWELRGGYWMPPGATMGIEGWHEEDWNPSEPRGIAAAWAVVEEIGLFDVNRDEPLLLWQESSGWIVGDNEFMIFATAPTAQLAICRAALKAKLAAAGKGRET